jgi:integrase/recombinase XerD
VTELRGTVVGGAAVPAVTPASPTPEQLAWSWVITKRSPNTRHSYGLDIGIPVPRPGVKDRGEPGPAKAPSWLAFCRAAGIDPLHAAEHHLALWARGMEAAGLSAPTVARKLSAVSSWYGWLVRNKHAAVNPAAELPRPEVDQDTSKTPGLTRDQAIAMLAAADASHDPQCARTAALTAVLLLTGARVSEACGADIADIGTDRGHRVLWVTRKGGKRQPLGLPGPAVARIEAYLADRADLQKLPALRGQAGRDRPLFATVTGNRMKPAEVWKLMRRIGKRGGLPDDLVTRMGAHAMRHSFATLYLDAGGSLRDLQDAMGHKDPRTTRRYDRSRNSLDRSPGYLLATYLAREDE